MAIKKVINSSTQQFEPVLVDKLVLDAVPTVNSFNSVTSDAVARAVAGASGEVPQVTSEDNGKFLKAIYDEGGAAVEWDTVEVPTVDQTYNASSANAQSGVAVAQAITASDKVSTIQSSQTEIDIDVKGNAPIKLIAEDYGSVPGPSTALSFSSAAYVSTQGGNPPYGIHVVFDLPSTQTIPISARITVNQDIVGSDPRYSLGSVYFCEAIDGYVMTNNMPTVEVSSMVNSSTILAGDYDVSITLGNPSESFSQVGFYITGSGQDTAWSDFVNYIIDNAATLFSISVPTTVKAARLLPAASSNDADKVLTVNASGKPEWANVTVDQTYSASSTNAQSGTAVAEAVGSPVNLVQGSGVTLTESSGNVTISANAQLPAYSDADSGKVLQVQADGTLAWVTLS